MEEIRTRILKYITKLTVFMAPIIVVAACSAEIDDSNLGAINCSDTHGAPQDAKIETNVEEFNLGCISSGNRANDISPQLMQFQVIREIKNADGQVIRKEPIPNAAMTPIVRGALGSTDVPEELQNDSRFRGIKTPKDEWCTDNFGFFTFEIVPVCLPGVENNITVEARSGAAWTEKPINITVTDQVEDDQNDGVELLELIDSDDDKGEEE